GDIAFVGGKNASLGEMFTQLTPKGIRIPKGFAVTVKAFRDFVAFNDLEHPISLLIKGLDRMTFSNLEEIGRDVRRLLISGRFPIGISREIGEAYMDMFEGGTKEVAVRSSATAE